MNNLKNLPKTQIFFLIVAFIMVAVIAFSVFFVPKKSPLKTTPTPDIKFTPPQIQSLPKKKNEGIDLESAQVKASKQELSKLVNFLPYQETLEDTEVLIPSLAYQPNAWTLFIQISGVDYQVLAEDLEYNYQKRLFLEGAKKAFSWIIDKDANPAKIIIVWGDKKYIQDRAEEWLKTQ